MTYYINHLGVINALGSNKKEVLTNMASGDQSGLVKSDWIPTASTYVAQIRETTLPEIPTDMQKYQCRNNQIALHAAKQIEDAIEQLKAHYGKEKVATVIGTSTSGIAEGENAVTAYTSTNERPTTYQYQQQEIGTVAEFIAEYFDLGGPAYTISTACSSSGHAFNSAIQMLDSGISDAVIVGGVDSLCKLTVNGFYALESVSKERTTPFSVNRNGINIGEGAALFIITREQGEEAISLLGVGASSDAHHISAPEPEGKGAQQAIELALKNASIRPEDITYINLHGTGTRLNDSMESKAVSRVFGNTTPCSSSKGQIGHSLGAAAANEIALCWLSLSSLNEQSSLPPHIWDGIDDPELEDILLTKPGNQFDRTKPQRFLSNSFAFGGNNVSVIIGKE